MKYWLKLFCPVLNRISTFSFAVLILGSTILLGGCADSPLVKVDNKPIDINPLKEGRQFSDIPSPEEAEFLKDPSFYYSGPDYRTAELIYRTKRRPKYLIEFYVEQMKIGDWTLERKYGNPPGTRMVFTKKQEICKVQLKRKKRDLTRIIIEIRRNSAAD